MKNSVKKVPFRFEKNVTQKSTLTSIKIIQPSICVVVALAPFYRLDFQDYFAPHSAKLTQPFYIVKMKMISSPSRATYGYIDDEPLVYLHISDVESRTYIGYVVNQIYY